MYLCKWQTVKQQLNNRNPSMVHNHWNPSHQEYFSSHYLNALTSLPSRLSFFPHRLICFVHEGANTASVSSCLRCLHQGSFSTWFQRAALPFASQSPEKMHIQDMAFLSQDALRKSVQGTYRLHETHGGVWRHRVRWRVFIEGSPGLDRACQRPVWHVWTRCAPVALMWTVWETGTGGSGAAQRPQMLPILQHFKQIRMAHRLIVKVLFTFVQDRVFISTPWLYSKTTGSLQQHHHPRGCLSCWQPSSGGPWAAATKGKSAWLKGNTDRCCFVQKSQQHC